MELAASGSLAPVTHRDTPRFADGHASEDARLVLAAREGDEGAFGGLYERYARMVHGLLLATGAAHRPRRSRARCFPDRLAAAADPARSGGVRRLAFHDCAESRDRFPSPRRGSRGSARRPAGARRHGGARRGARVLDLIRTLPEAYRETLVLRLVEGLTGPEIADRTGLTAASVRVNLHRGMKLLREKLHA